MYKPTDNSVRHLNLNKFKMEDEIERRHLLICATKEGTSLNNFF